MMSFIVQKLKSFLLFFIGIFRRALCCFRRKRHPSCESIPLLTIGVIPNSAGNGAEFESWNWEDAANQIKSDTFKPNSVQDHIEQYRQQKAMLARQKQMEKLENEQENFFEDMTPKITRQTKVFLNSDDNDNSSNITSRLALNPQGIIPTDNAELGEWEEGAGWEEQTQTDFDTQNILREKRRQERERRLWEQQQKKQEKFNRPLGARIS